MLSKTCEQTGYIRLTKLQPEIMNVATPSLITTMPTLQRFFFHHPHYIPHIKSVTTKNFVINDH